VVNPIISARKFDYCYASLRHATYYNSYQCNLDMMYEIKIDKFPNNNVRNEEKRFMNKNDFAMCATNKFRSTKYQS